MLDEFYIFKLGYHFFELCQTISRDRDRRDFMEYFLHHLLTAALIFFSYTLNCMPVGAAVMILHDITDLAVSIFKLTVDITPI